MSEDHSEELLLEIVGLTLSARGRVAMLIALTVGILLRVVAWRILRG
jgi:hypothetical protein